MKVGPRGERNGNIKSNVSTSNMAVFWGSAARLANKSMSEQTLLFVEALHANGSGGVEWLHLESWESFDRGKE